MDVATAAVQQHAARAAALYSGRPSAPCFAPAPLFDLGLGAPVAAFELGQELCASADAIRMNSYLDWGEVVGYTLLWSIVWLAFHLFTRRFVLGPLVRFCLQYAGSTSHGGKVSPSPVPATPAALLDKPVSTLATARSPAVLCLNRVPPISGAAESGPAATDAPRSPAYALPNGRDPAASLPHRASAAPKPALVAKCVTAGTKFLNYSITFASSLWVFTRFAWWDDSPQWWAGWLVRDIEPLVQQYLFFYLGFYVYQMAVLLKEPRLKDFWVMAVHHIVTMTLVSFAYAAGHYRIALPFIIVHDMSDPLMEIAKVFHYTRTEVRGVPLADVFFILFAGVFFVSRIVVYPRYLLWSALVHPPQVCPYCKGVLLGFIFAFVLLLLHVYWMSLIVRMVWKAIVNKGVQGDIRESDDEDEDKDAAS
jgi:hypothetical protein